MTTGKPVALTVWTFVGKMMSLLCNMQSRFVRAFLPRSKFLLILWLQSPSSEIFGAQENKICHCFYFFSICSPWSDGTNAVILVFECWIVSQLFHSPLSPWSIGSLVPVHFLSLEWYHLHIWSCWYFSWQSWFQLSSKHISFPSNANSKEPTCQCRRHRRCRLDP